MSTTGRVGVVEVTAPAERSALCASVLRELPDWFGIEEAIGTYIAAAASLPTFAAGDDGFLSLKLHTPQAAEILVMGVRPERHGQGIGTALVEAAESYLRERGVEYLQVKTLGPSRPDEGYEATRRFYERRGFAPLEEVHGLWDEANPCLIMVKRL